MYLRFAISLFFLVSACAILHAQEKKPLVIAHRGASGYAPENTIAAIDKALELGADVIEIDVHQTKDSVVMVMHDVKLDRTTDKEGLIKDHNWDEIKDADAGSWYGAEFTGSKIPTLDEVIKHLDGRAKLLIEIKNGGDYYPGIERRTWQIVEANGAANWCMMQSFSDAAVKSFLMLDAGMPVYKLTVARVREYKGVAGVNPYQKFAKKRTIKRVRKRGQQIFVWTVNKEKQMRNLIERKIDGIITNYPDKVKKLLED